MRIHRAASGSAARLRQPGLTLPPALAEKAVTRLCGVALMAAISLVIGYVAIAALQPELAAAYRNPLVRLSALCSLLAPGVFLAMHRSGRFSKQTILQLGVVFQVAVAFFISMFECAVPFGNAEYVRGVSAVALWMSLCGLTIPSTPAMNLMAGLSSAAMWPAAYFATVNLYQHEWIGWSRIAAWCFPLLLTAVWTNLINRRIYRIELESHAAEELGSYTLDSLIGRGGMGEVWRARHRMLARDAAIKVIRPEVLASQSLRDADTMRKRFEQEAQATARLRSPHTVALYDFGVSRDQSFFYVMELLDGIDLQTLVERHGPLPAGRVRNIIVQTCESLEEAHGHGLVHRDIKPRNLALCKLGLEYDFVKVLDFGLVKKTDADDHDAQMSFDGMATGTPAFMPPEIALGKRDIDGRADIYSLGCVAYYLLTGEMVFDEPSGMAAALAHVQKQPVPPSERTEMPVPASIEQMVMQCLEKDPEKRPGSAWELARRLEALTDIPRFCRDSAKQWWQLHGPSADAEPRPAEPARISPGFSSAATWRDW